MSNKEDRWIVRYRRYHTDSISERVFTTSQEANEFARNYLYDRGSDAQARVVHFQSIPEVESEK